MAKNKKIQVEGKEITILFEEEKEYISLADMLKAKDGDFFIYDSFLTNGHSEYYGKDEYKVVSQPTHEIFTIAKDCNRENFLHQLNLYEQGKTNYFGISKGVTESGIEKWTFNTV
jgi:hypothetical protein